MQTIVTISNHKQNPQTHSGSAPVYYYYGLLTKYGKELFGAALSAMNVKPYIYAPYKECTMNIRLKKEEKIRVLCSDDLYDIMQRILVRESRIDRNREHLWTVSLDTAYRILNIELVSLGTVNKTLVEPMEVFSVPLQKRAVKLIVVHNHPSGQLVPSEQDKDITDQLIQVGRIMKVPLMDHLIISETDHYSFLESGLLHKLEQSLKYVPAYEIKRRYEKAAKEIGNAEGRKEERKEIARQMKKEGYTTDAIMKITGLSKGVIGRLKVE